MPLNCNTLVPLYPRNTPVSSGSMQRSVYTTNRGLALVYDIIQKMPYAPSLNQRTALTVPSVIGISISTSRYEDLQDTCISDRFQPRILHRLNLKMLGCLFPVDTVMSCALMDASGVLHESCLFSGKRSDNPGRRCSHLESFLVQSELVVAHVSFRHPSLS